MNNSKNLLAYGNALSVLKQSSNDLSVSVNQLGNQFVLMNGKQQASVLVKILNSNADKTQKQEAINYLLTLNQVDAEEQKNIKPSYKLFLQSKLMVKLLRKKQMNS